MAHSKVVFCSTLDSAQNGVIRGQIDFVKGGVLLGHTLEATANEVA